MESTSTPRLSQTADIASLKNRAKKWLKTIARKKMGSKSYFNFFFFLRPICEKYLLKDCFLALALHFNPNFLMLPVLSSELPLIQDWIFVLKNSTDFEGFKRPFRPLPKGGIFRFPSNCKLTQDWLLVLDLQKWFCIIAKKGAKICKYFTLPLQQKMAHF